jgi:predicted RNase H-like HicB family nuclease
MRYPIAIEPGTDQTSFGVVVPDLPGCYSAGDTLDEAITNAEEAIAAWIDATLDAGDRIPPASTVDVIRERDLYAGWIFAVINVDPSIMDDRVERINITLPRRVLRRLDAAAEAVGESRSGFIATMTLVRTEIPTPRRKSKEGARVVTRAKTRGPNPLKRKLKP